MWERMEREKWIGVAEKVGEIRRAAAVDCSGCLINGSSFSHERTQHFAGLRQVHRDMDFRSVSLPFSLWCGTESVILTM
jgi:hypothetical protein